MAGRENTSKTSEFIRNKRESLGITQAELAEKGGVSERYIRALEAGTKSNPSANLVYRLSKALEIYMEDLMKKEEEPQG